MNHKLNANRKEIFLYGDECLVDPNLISEMTQNQIIINCSTD